MSNKATISKTNTEIEIRGALPSKTLLPKLIEQINKQEKATIKQDKEIVVFYKKNNQDFRIKWERDKTHFEFIYKTKQGVQRTVRNEFIITINKRQIEDFFKILDELGLERGFISPTHRIDVATPFILWSFKLGSVIGNYWEAEATSNLVRKFKGKTDKIKRYLENKARSLGLNFWSEEEFKRIRREKWQKIKPAENSKIIEILLNDRY